MNQGPGIPAGACDPCQQRDEDAKEPVESQDSQDLEQDERNKMDMRAAVLDFPYGLIDELFHNYLRLPQNTMKYRLPPNYE